MVSLVSFVLRTCRCVLLLSFPFVVSQPYVLDCEVSRNHSSCANLNTVDVMRSVKYLSDPATTTCNDTRVLQGLSVCFDVLPKTCRMLTVLTSDDLNDLGTLAFEKYWSKYCSVTVMHYSLRGRNKHDKVEKGFQVNRQYGFPIYRLKMWDRRLFSGFFLHANSIINEPVDVLKVQELEFEPNSDGIVPRDKYEWLGFAVLADLYNYPDHLACCVDSIYSKTISGVTVGQIIFRISFNQITLIDYKGRESSNAANMYAIANTLYDYGTFAASVLNVSEALWPVLLEHYVQSVGFNYKVQKVVSFMQLPGRHLMQENREKWLQWQPVPPSDFPDSAQHLSNDINRPIHLPPFCRIPIANYEKEIKGMTSWVQHQLNARCHPTIFTSQCDFSKTYEGFVPCPGQVTEKLVEEYAVAKGWCDLLSANASILPLSGIPSSISDKWNSGANSTRKESIHLTFKRKDSGRLVEQELPRKRIAFMLLMHSDPVHAERLLARVYNPYHYYLLHIDPGNKNKEFVSRMVKYADGRDNVYISRGVPIIYPASSATIAIVRAMAWYLEYIKDWDYIMLLTGQDYPLIPLSRIESILCHQNPAMPFLMTWHADVNVYIRKLRAVNPVYEQDAEIVAGIKGIFPDRGLNRGTVPMEFRTFNFGLPLTCNGGRGWYRLDPRRNAKPGSVEQFDTQNLFSVGTRKPRKHLAVTYQRESDTHLYNRSSDGVFRRWVKSDPMFTGAYDRQTVEYILKSEEGVKYYNYFSRFVMGSEEHYFASLLYNYNRTRSFVSSLRAQVQFNTWKLGIYLPVTDGFKMHAHYLNFTNIGLLRGMSKRGVFFARKFCSWLPDNVETLNMIDEQLLGIDCEVDWYCRKPSVNRIPSNIVYNITSEAGRYWPGYVKGNFNLNNKLFFKATGRSGMEAFPIF